MRRLVCEDLGESVWDEDNFNRDRALSAREDFFPLGSASLSLLFPSLLFSVGSREIEGFLLASAIAGVGTAGHDTSPHPSSICSRSM